MDISLNIEGVTIIAQGNLSTVRYIVFHPGKTSAIVSYTVNYHITTEGIILEQRGSFLYKQRCEGLIQSGSPRITGPYSVVLRNIHYTAVSNETF